MSAAGPVGTSRHTSGTKTSPTRMTFGVTLAVGGGPGCPT
jgi:hypothetical protein